MYVASLAAEGRDAPDVPLIYNTSLTVILGE